MNREQGSALYSKVVIVTGSTSGIGLGIAQAFAASGMDIVLNGFGAMAEIERTRADLALRYGVKVVHSPADMSKPAEIRDMVQMATETLGKVDVLVNNAGILHIDPVDKTPPEKWDAMLAINLTAVFHGVRAVVPSMKARRWGRIINVSSALGLVGAPQYSAYAASKHAVVGLTKTVALETAEHGITVNAICPGYVLTPLVQREIETAIASQGITSDEAIRRALLHVQPSRRFVATTEIGALAAFLCSDAGASITGAALPVDGAWTAQ
jgi:3-hydroxybutyrate dehydrogenase